MHVNIQKNLGLFFALSHLLSPNCCKNAALLFPNIFIKLKSCLGSRNGTNGKRMTRKSSMCVRGGMFTPCLFVLGRNSVLCEGSLPARLKCSQGPVKALPSLSAEGKEIWAGCPKLKLNLNPIQFKYTV